MSEHWPWDSPESTRQGLRSLIANRYPPEVRSRRMLEVSFRRFLVRLARVDSEHAWVLKGGVSLILRLDPNRTSADIDLVYVSDREEYAVAIRSLEVAFSEDAGDFMTFQFAGGKPPKLDLSADTVELPVTVTIGGREWQSFHIDLGRPRANVPGEPLTSFPELTGVAAVDYLPDLTVIPLSQQVAEKTCAMFEIYGATGRGSTRARDLADVAMVAGQKSGIQATDLTKNLNSEEARRIETGTLLEPLGKSFSLPDDVCDDWRSRWEQATHQQVLTFDAAYTIAQHFLTPILAGQARGTWRANLLEWREN